MNSPEDQPWKDLKCSQCNGPFFLFGGWTDIRHPLCQKCWTLHQKTLGEMEERNIRGINFALTEAEDASGMQRGFYGRYQVAPSKPTTVIGDFILNNIKIDRSTIGLLNTGSIGGSVEHIDASISMFSKDPAMQAFQEALKGFTEAVLKSTEASNDQKEAILELMSVIAEEARLPKEKQRSTVAKILIKNAQEMVGAISSLHSMWQTLQPIIVGIFS